VVRFAPQPLYPRESTPGTHWIGGWVDRRATLDDVEKRKFLTLQGLKLRPLGHPARDLSLYQLRYLRLNVNKILHHGVECQEMVQSSGEYALRRLYRLY
jgi:hypothetical protein